MEKQDYSINKISMIFQNMDKCGLRLTKPELDLCEECTNGSLCKLLYNPCPAKLVYTKLSQYEDTGLTPEEVQIQKEAMERMGWFGKMFQRYAGDPRGPIGTFGNALEKFLVESCIEPARNRQVLKDVDGNTWLPMLQDEFRAMADFIERVQGWIPVEERLPEKHSEYIVCACDEGEPIDERIWGDTVVVCADYYDGGFTWYEGNTEYDISDIVTHWMPLPEPPKEASHD